MDEKKIHQGRNDSRRNISSSERDSEYDVLRKCIEKLNSDIISTRNCYDYVLAEINVENDNITRSLIWNQQRLKMLKDINNNLGCYYDRQNELYREMFNLLINDNNKV